MFKKLDFILQKYEELSLMVADPDVIANQTLWQKHIREMGDMEPLVKKYQEYKKAEEDLAGAKEMLSDSDLAEMAKEEVAELTASIESLTQELKILLLPKDPNDEKNVYL